MSKERATLATGMATSFGFSEVDRNDKQSLVNQVFHRVAGRYDLMNDLMCAGCTGSGRTRWSTGSIRRSPAIGACSTSPAAPATSPSASLEARRARRARHRRSTSTPRCSPPAAQERPSSGSPAVDFVEANAEALPFADGRFDAYTIAFGIRNVPRIDDALREAHRVLKPGGRFLCLEFSEVDVPSSTRSTTPIPSTPSRRSASWWPATREAYHYLVEFDPHVSPTSEHFAAHDRARPASPGSRYRNYSGGIAALHSGWKL